MPKLKSFAKIEREMAEERGRQLRQKMKGETLYGQPIKTVNQIIFKAYLMGKDEQFMMDLQAHDEARGSHA